MFILWVKTYINDYKSELKALKKIGLGFLALVYVLLTFFGCVSILTFDILGEVANTSLDVFANVYFKPFGYIFGIIPVLAIIGYYIGLFLYKLYLDYSYFAANGGKRKRDEKKKTDIEEIDYADEDNQFHKSPYEPYSPYSDNFPNATTPNSIYDPPYRTHVTPNDEGKTKGNQS